MTEQNEVKYAGKFKTVEELEEGYKNSAKVFQENETLKKELENISKAPEQYVVPDDIAFDEGEWEAIKADAKDMNLSQAHFDKLARKRFGEKTKEFESYNEGLKSIDESQYTVLQDFVKKTYPQSLHDEMLRKAVSNKSVREDILKQRERMLDSRVAGMGQPPKMAPSITRDDLLKAAQAAEKARGSEKSALQKKHLALTQAFTRQQEGR